MSRWKDCPECKSKLSCELGLYGYAPRCPKCQRIKNKLLAQQEKQRLTENKGMGSIFIPSGKKEVTAFGYEKNTGRMVGITPKGEHVSPDKTFYDLRNDPKGWRSAGYKVRDRDERGRKQ